MTRIRWEQKTGTGSDGWKGFVGEHKRPMFNISRSLVREVDGNWLLATTLPWPLKVSQFADDEHAKVYAERVLDVFVRRMGATFDVEA